MDTTTVISLASFGLAVPQSLAGLLFVWEWMKTSKGGAPVNLLKKSLTCIILVGALVSVWFGAWLCYHPIKPIVKTEYVEKLVPCPPSKTGNATARGAGAIAHSGNNDTFIRPATTEKKGPK